MEIKREGVRASTNNTNDGRRYLFSYPPAAAGVIVMDPVTSEEDLPSSNNNHHHRSSAAAAATNTTTTTSSPVEQGIIHQDDIYNDNDDDDDDDDDCPSLIIPITSSSSSSSNKGNTNLFIEIFPEEMANIRPNTLATVLRDERAPLPTWCAASHLYLKAGQHQERESFDILNVAAENEEGIMSGSNNADKLRLLACAGIAALALANRSVVAAENGSGTNLDGSSASSSGGGGTSSAASAMGGGEGGNNHNTISSSSIDGGNTTTTGSTTTTTATGKTLLETLLESSKASEKRDADQKEELRVLADTRFTKADNINQVNPMTWIGRGMLNLAQNRLDQARFFFENLTLRECGEILPALLGMAAVKYMEKDYAGALELYGRAISKYPKQSGSATRVGFGMACYRLGQIDRAKAAFRRAHELDSTNVEALVGIAVLEMSSLDPDVLDPREYRSKSENVIKMISMANLVDPTNAMVQNHLANHYFWKWTPVPGMVSVERGSNVVRGSMASSLEGGDRIRIGHEFETVVALDEEDDGMMMMGSENMFRIKDAWKSDSACK